MSSILDERIDAAMLEAASDDELSDMYWTLVLQRFGREMGNTWKPEREFEIADALSPSVRMFYYTFELEGDVLNGGFDQFFYNKPVEFAERALAEYRLLGVDEMVSVVEDALHVYRLHEQRMDETKTRTTIEDVFAAFRQSPFREIDNRLADLYELMRATRIAHAQAHQDEYLAQ